METFWHALGVDPEVDLEDFLPPEKQDSPPPHLDQPLHMQNDTDPRLDKNSAAAPDIFMGASRGEGGNCEAKIKKFAKNG